MKAYKGFHKDLSCIGYQFKEGKTHKTDHANCVQNGFHCAENPLDCFTYYPDWNSSVYYIVEAGGDLDEDGTDTKISCTEMKLIKKLTLEDMVRESLLFIQKKPRREFRERREACIIVKYDEAMTTDRAVIVRGKHPKAAGGNGAVLGLVREDEKSVKVAEVATVVVDGVNIKENTWYTLLDGQLKAE